MTKQEAVKRIGKLERVARDRGAQPNEIENANRRIAELKTKYSLNSDDIDQGKRAEAFDDLVGELDRYAGRSRDQIPSAVFEVFEKIKKETSEKGKAEALVTVTSSIRVASMFFGYNKTVRHMKETINQILVKYEITI